MDPLTAIGLASNIIAFIDFSAKVISGAVEIHETFSGDSAGLTEGNRSTLTVATEMKHLASKLQPPDQTQLTGDDKALCALAKECEGLSSQITALLEKVKAQGKKSRRSSLKAAFKTRCSKVISRLDNIIASAKNDASKLEHLYNQVHDYQRGVPVSSLSITAQSQLKSLLGVSEHASDLITQHRILESLSFPGMYQRYDEVTEAHDQTLRWIFGEDPIENFDGQSIDDTEDTDVAGEVDDSPTAGTDHAKDAARETITTWLSSGDGIFHVSGKLGSGKSTLIKYLYEHHCTTAMLQEWAGSHKLIHANFFFWKPGSTMQKSLPGLYRSLLHSVLLAAPELIHTTFPEIWSHLKSTPWQVTTSTRFSEKDTRRALFRLISDATLNKNHRICFFIDGLDEYQGTLQEDAKCLVELLSRLTANSRGGVKMCVSSREDNVFMNAFAATQRIRVHEVTRSDMKQYVSTKLPSTREEGGKEELTETIVHNSSGIFLWVALVVRRIRDQIENGHGLVSLRREIDALPKEMEGLLALILNSLSELDLKEAYQIFSMVIKWNKYDGGFLSIMSYSFLDEYNQNPTFVFDEDFSYTRLQPANLTTRRNLAFKRLNGCCRGLVEAVLHRYQNAHDGPDEDTNDYAIVFTHRCVSEFLLGDRQQDHMLRLLLGFNSVDAISHLVLAELLADPHLVQRQDLGDSLTLLTSLRIGSKIEHAPYRFLEAFCSALSKSRNIVPAPSAARFQRWVVLPYLEAQDPRSEYARIILGQFDEVNYLCPLGRGIFPHPIYHAAYLGNSDYVRWKLARDVDVGAHFKMEIVLYSMLFAEAQYRTTDVMDIVRLLIDKGLSPNAMATIWDSELAEAERGPPETGGLKEQRKIDVTVWQQLLLRCWPREWTNFDIFRFRHTVEIFLEHGADPYFELTTEKSKDGKMLYSLILGRERRKLLLRNERYEYAPFKGTSLTEYIRLCGFQNDTKIMELVEKKMRQGISENMGTLSEVRIPGCAKMTSP
ncbi:P-loop containing nucleoside triphosphate hydrolase [Fusarium albosuccineum]|uniref:P-loop containing nucleoside triphosphate hydrolase n=1 Tax=Fusarium albosuccineum TaxID=1237068 RepID=A0A8H4PIH2_9HYPO|nr:P-loop containing nucleoside triphosphate hydrolase [Fusarium albosuccineum]